LTETIFVELFLGVVEAYEEVAARLGINLDDI
jgi:hypothetical protein